MMQQAILEGLDMRRDGSSQVVKMGGFICGRSDALIEHKWNVTDFELALIKRKIQASTCSEERCWWYGYKIGWESVVRSLGLS